MIEAMRSKINFTRIFPAACLVLCLVLSACKTKPVPVVPEEVLPELSAPSLVFQTIEADDPIHLRLGYALKMENPFPQAGRVRLESWRVELNGQKAEAGFDLENSADLNFRINAALAEGVPTPVSIPVRLNMDVSALRGLGLAPADDYKANLILKLNFSPESGVMIPSVTLEVSGIAAFPGVQEPVFNITSIAILKAELINTRFRVGLKIDNPNPFPVELSAFGYELYGNGRLWADGIEKNVLKVNAKSSLQGNLFLLMNFINMKRDLLDQIIYLVDVNYRFSGDAMVGTGVEYLPEFKTSFNLSGYSQVFDR